MTIFKKIVKNFLIVLGLLLALAFILLFCMYFFKVKIFGLGYKFDDEKLFEEQITETFGEVQIVSSTIPVNVVLGSENKIVVKDQITGVVKMIKNDVGEWEIPTVSLTKTLTANTLKLEISEPEKFIAFNTDSEITLTLTQAIIENNLIVINSQKSDINVDFGDKVANSLEIESVSSKIEINSQVDSLSLISQKGKFNANNTIKNLSVKVEKTPIYVKTITENANIMANASHITFDKIGKSLFYTGFEKADGVYKQTQASTGKISGNLITDGLTVSCRNLDCYVEEVSKSIEFYSAYKSKIQISKATLNTHSKIELNKGFVKIGNLQAFDCEITTKTANVEVGAQQYSSNDSLIISTKSGDVNLIGAISFNYFSGELTVKSEKGDISLKKMACLVNAKTASKGKIYIQIYNNIKNGTSLQTEKGKVEAYVQVSTKCYLSVFTNKSKSINLPTTKQFAKEGILTPIYNAGDNDKVLLTLKSNKGAITINEFFG